MVSPLNLAGPIMVIAVRLDHATIKAKITKAVAMRMIAMVDGGTLMDEEAAATVAVATIIMEEVEEALLV
jgi:hypothetical protein